MKKSFFFLSFVLALFALALFLPNLSVFAQETPSPPAAAPAATPERAAERDRPRPIRDVMPDARRIDGLITFYHQRDRLYAEIKSSNLNVDYLIGIAIARGSGSTVVGGDTYHFGGNDWLWQFRKVNDNIQVVRRNIHFRADPGTPEARAVEVGFSDSVLFSLPIRAIGEGGGDVIDLAPIFMTDLPRLNLGTFDRNRSTWGEIKGFPNNMEFRVVATYSGPTRSAASIDPNSTGVTIHYSISRLPTTAYTPRIADPRIGFFTVTHRNFSRAAEDNHVIRYINRWNIQKADPSAAMSPPKRPIVFWIERTVPFKYRDAVRQGILEWNRAFERIGIVNAIEVRQQADTDTWDAEDIRYNVVRWITSERTFAKGPSRVNPLTGEILDSDVIIDAGWITHWRDRFDYLIGDVIPSATSNDADSLFAQHNTSTMLRDMIDSDSINENNINNRAFSYAQGRAGHFALASLALALENEEGNGGNGGNGSGEAEEAEENGDKEESEEAKTEEQRPTRQELLREREAKMERLILAGLKDLVTHEIGHSLGLRHNFAASSWLTLDEINDPDRCRIYGHAGSVMDYLPINIAPRGQPQGDFFMSGLGPYDFLAIEYGYRIIPGGQAAERRELARIASRQAEPGNLYATDEDLWLNVDPRTGTWDLGRHPLEFAQRAVELYNQLMPEILERAIREDGRYRDVGRFYRLLVNQRAQANATVMRNLTGLYRNRDRRGDPGDRPPIQVVAAQTKRDTVQFLCDNTFGADAFRIDPEIYNRFGQEIWLGRGDAFERAAPISLSAVITSIQCGTLTDLLSPRVLYALTDAALRVSDDEDVYTIEELFSTVTASVFSELDSVREGEFSPRQPAIPASRRTLQEHLFRLLAHYASGEGLGTSPDVHSSRALARHELAKLEEQIQTTLTGARNWDTGSIAHLTMLRDRIQRLLEASLAVGRP